MPFNVLILPLIGGYLFITHYFPTRLRSRRLVGYRLLIEAALVGFILLVMGWILIELSESVIPRPIASLRDAIHLNHIGKSVIALILGGLIWLPINHICYKNKERRVKIIRKSIKAWANHIEELFFEAQYSQQMIAVTLRSGKVYIGYVLDRDNPIREDVLILPIQSGYRDHNSYKYIFTTDYTSAYSAYLKNKNKYKSFPEIFGVAFSIKDISQVGKFDPELYMRFHDTVQ